LGDAWLVQGILDQLADQAALALFLGLATQTCFIDIEPLLLFHGFTVPPIFGARPASSRTWLRYDPKYQGVRELVEALELLAEPKLTKAMPFVQQPPGRRVWTNNHAERLNRRLRFAEKVRYRWPQRK
jgi:hypothetical protein